MSDPGLRLAALDRAIDLFKIMADNKLLKAGTDIGEKQIVMVAGLFYQFLKEKVE